MSLILSFRWRRDYHGRSGNDGDNEWPPSPWRLFCSLIAADNPASPAAILPSLLWLASKGNPTIFTPPTDGAYGKETHSVPINDLTSKDDPFRESDIARRRLIKFRQDICLPLRGSKEVWFVWEIDAEEAAPHLAALDDLMAKVPYIGTSQDSGSGRAWLHGPKTLDAEDRSRWEPAAAPGVSLPTATDDVLRKLVEFHQRQQAQTRRFADVNPPRVFYRRADDPQALQVVFRLEDEQGDLVSVEAAESCALAEAFRASLFAAAKEVGVSPEFIHGHHDKGRNHVFIAPLPSIGNRHADGRIRRIMLFGVPEEGERRDVDLVLRQFAFSKLNHGGKHAVLVPEDTYSGVANAYVSSATQWQTVTPLMLPNPELRSREGHLWKSRQKLSKEDRQALTDKLQSRRVAMVKRMLSNAGLTPAAVAVSQAPFGSVETPAGKFVVPDGRKKYLKNTLCHVSVEFAEPVTGPLVLGRGKHFGLGLFAPTRALQWQTPSEVALAS
jgi:CRISPR-associated protein Csb2